MESPKGPLIGWIVYPTIPALLLIGVFVYVGPGNAFFNIHNLPGLILALAYLIVVYPVLCIEIVVLAKSVSRLMQYPILRSRRNMIAAGYGALFVLLVGAWELYKVFLNY